MNKDKLKLISLLETVVDASLKNRNSVATIVYEDYNLFSNLIPIVFKVDHKISIKAAWILERITSTYNVYCILSQLDLLTKNIHQLYFDSAIRPCAKVCEQVAFAYAHKNKNPIHENLSKSQIDRIVSAAFNWLMTPQKTAVKAYSMNILYLFGIQLNWIHPELKHLISSKIIHESKGCKSRGKKVLELIEKHQKRTQ